MLKIIRQQVSSNREKLTNIQKARLFSSLLIGTLSPHLMEKFIGSEDTARALWQQLACVLIFTTLVWWGITGLSYLLSKDKRI